MRTPRLDDGLPRGGVVPFNVGVPKPPVPPQSGLDEVERALSVLEGRHPEHERIARETREAAQVRRRELEKELSAAARRRRRRAALVTLNVAALGAAAYVGWKLFARAHLLRQALAPLEAPFLQHGLQEIATNELAAGRTLQVDAPELSCFVAVAARGAVRVQAGGSAFEGAHSAGWCGCGRARVSVTTAAAGIAPVGLAVLRIEATKIGGPLARPWTDFHPDVWGPGGGGCADAVLDGWLSNGHGALTPAGNEACDVLRGGGTLRGAGFQVLGVVEASRPFGAASTEAGTCSLAVADGQSLSLRLAGGTRVASSTTGALAWCSSAPVSATVWHAVETSSHGAAHPAGAAAGSMTLMSAPADRIGGIFGVREIAAEAGYSLAAAGTWLRQEDLAWDATALLRASTGRDVAAASMPEEPGAADGRIAAISLVAPARAAWDPPAVVVACDPSLGDQAQSVCASAAPVSWWRRGGAASIARARPPIWLSPLEGHHEPDAVARIPELLGLARRLARQSYEPTVLEGVTELPQGVRVVGRAGEDAVVAVGIGPKPPWVFPYSDRVPWDLGDAPRAVPLQPGASVTLVSSPPCNIPLEERRTVVFRHAIRP